MKVFIIGWEKELSVKIGLIMKNKAMRENMFGKKANGVGRFDKKPEEKGATPKE